MKKMRRESPKPERERHRRARPGHRMFVADRGAVRFDLQEEDGFSLVTVYGSRLTPLLLITL
jgi:hypothetical protein